MGEDPHGGRTRRRSLGLIHNALSDRVMAGLGPGHLVEAGIEREDRDARVKLARDDTVGLTPVTPPNAQAPRAG
jgi:hypothetical protein